MRRAQYTMDHGAPLQAIGIVYSEQWRTIAVADNLQ